MGKEEEIQRHSCSSSSSISIGLVRSSKKVQKQKKVPQRGLGVAQLEKIRLQDQQFTKYHSQFSSWDHQFNLEKENCGLHVDPLWPIQSPLDPSLMNVSSRSPSSSSSLVNLQMELPSNQTNPSWKEEEKMVGTKRSYPYGYGMENTVCPSCHCKLPSFERSEESISFGIHGPSTLNPYFRCRDSIISENWKKMKKENGDFLTLAPPPTTTSNSKSESFDFSSLPYQASIEDEIDEAALGGASLKNQLQTFYGFRPPPIMPIAQPDTCDFADNVIDLNLKL